MRLKIKCKKKGRLQSQPPPSGSAVLVATTRVRVVVEVCALEIEAIRMCFEIEILTRIRVENFVFGIHLDSLGFSVESPLLDTITSAKGGPYFKHFWENIFAFAICQCRSQKIQDICNFYNS